MVAISGGLIFLGYQLLTYGWSQVQGSNAGFFDLLWPGRYKGNTPDASAIATQTKGLGSQSYGGLNDTASGGTIGKTPVPTSSAPGYLGPTGSKPL